MTRRLSHLLSPVLPVSDLPCFSVVRDRRWNPAAVRRGREAVAFRVRWRWPAILVSFSAVIGLTSSLWATNTDCFGAAVHLKVPMISAVKAMWSGSNIQHRSVLLGCSAWIPAVAGADRLVRRDVPIRWRYMLVWGNGLGRAESPGRRCAAGSLGDQTPSGKFAHSKSPKILRRPPDSQGGLQKAVSEGRNEPGSGESDIILKAGLNQVGGQPWAAADLRRSQILGEGRPRRFAPCLGVRSRPVIGTDDRFGRAPRLPETGHFNRAPCGAWGNLASQPLVGSGNLRTRMADPGQCAFLSGSRGLTVDPTIDQRDLPIHGPTTLACLKTGCVCRGSSGPPPV